MSSEQYLLFADLPAEIRLLIWKYAITQRRAIVYVSKSNPRTPAILHVNQEARSEALRYYESFRRSGAAVARFQGFRNYFSMDFDTFIVESCYKHYWGLLNNRRLKARCKHLALTGEEWNFAPVKASICRWMNLLCQHANLETITLLYDRRGDNFVPEMLIDNPAGPFRIELVGESAYAPVLPSPNDHDRLKAAMIAEMVRIRPTFKWPQIRYGWLLPC